MTRGDWIFAGSMIVFLSGLIGVVVATDAVKQRHEFERCVSVLSRATTPSDSLLVVAAQPGCTRALHPESGR